MRMMYIKGNWYHILETIETPFYRDNFEKRYEYIILEGDIVKYLRPGHTTGPTNFDKRITTQEELSKIISETESSTWRSEDRRKAYLSHFKKISQIMREHIIKEVLTDKLDYNFFDIC